MLCPGGEAGSEQTHCVLQHRCLFSSESFCCGIWQCLIFPAAFVTQVNVWCFCLGGLSVFLLCCFVFFFLHLDNIFPSVTAVHTQARWKQSFGLTRSQSLLLNVGTPRSDGTGAAQPQREKEGKAACKADLQIKSAFPTVSVRADAN